MSDLHPTVEVGRFVTVLLRRWRTIVVCLVVAMIAAAAYLALAPTSVTATAQVNIEVITDQPFSGQRQPSALIDAATERELARSTEVVERAAEALGGGITARQVRRGLSVEVLAGATVMRIGYTADNATTAVKVADEVASQYLRYRGELATERQQAALAPLIERRDALQAQLQQAATGRTALLNELSQLVSQISGITTLGTSGGTFLVHASDVAPTVSPRSTTVLAAAGLLGLLGGAVLAVVADAVRRRVHDATDVVAGGGGPLLASLRARQPAELASEHDADALLTAWHRLRPQIDVDVPVMLVVGASDGAPAAEVAQALEQAAGAVEAMEAMESGSPTMTRRPRAVPVPAEEGHAVALRLAPRAGLVVIAAEKGRTTVREIDALVDHLAAVSVRPAGTVVAHRFREAGTAPHRRGVGGGPTPLALEAGAAEATGRGGRQ
ncbi:Wzz/FepE/Etk N-terminal domain-containing protein [Nocardioides humi]|uniref:Polysaccharide chain length determinant N-terminal domain-containing protein n=1 Tax=Nocardioides humi TaxID=449461 RepID=A0ABN2AX76_9ACTN|nr:Wzz/FepE/Etk N-terminal domain-containing protein [Nocardioides humi]